MVVFTADSSTIYYIHNDHLGTPQKITNASQQVVWAADYEPFGKVSLTVNNLTFDTRFPGQHFDAESGLHYNYFRDYDPEIGRYIQSDPIGLGDGVNTYGYVHGDPINYYDPNGKSAVRWSLPFAGGLAVSDGPFPVGDAIAAALLGGALIYDAFNPSYNEEAKLPGERTPEEEAQADAEYQWYKDICNMKRLPTGDFCQDLKNEIERAFQCARARQSFDDSWSPGAHDVEIQKEFDRGRRLQELYDEMCKEEDCE
ncbi:RHS repeat domain-containing protein [Marinagarivorans algicola]|uniref:RHS repeat domain-containing protein n=1 Tax=Marinagarivorans algicola TaxID=1513270 RepID=UPI000AF7ABFF|nr:RHS repeat-associated core domain-containing protein [Marinagarivorans algicola]